MADGIYSNDGKILDMLVTTTTKTTTVSEKEGLSPMMIQFIIVGVLFGLVLLLGLVNVYIHLKSNRRKRGFSDFVGSGQQGRVSGGSGDGPKRTKAMLLF